MDAKEAYIRQLENQISAMQKQIDNLTELILIMRQDKFGASSEKTPKDTMDGQLSLFDEAEAFADASMPEPVTREVQGYFRKNSRTKRAERIKDLPVREELEYIPAKLQIVRYTREACECPECKRTARPFIMKAQTPTSLMNHSLASPGSVANVMYQKYVNSVPLYRQEKDWENLRLSLKRATMAHWIIRCAQDDFTPVIKHLKKELVSREVLHCDETPVQVLKEEGKKPQSKSYMWLYRTGCDDKPPIVLYDYQPTRCGDHAVEFLRGFRGYLHTDGYSGYNKLENITRCGCWAHLRRKFVEAVAGKKASGAPPTAAETGRDYCDRLFRIEKQLKESSMEERYKKRLELEKPVLEAFWC